jgi:predicted RNA binding protein YcfA (HicA-like mRNA interferase family)
MVKAKNLIRSLKKDGWYRVKTKGSHHHFKHPLKLGKVTVSGYSNDIAIGTLHQICKQAKLLTSSKCKRQLN